MWNGALETGTGYRKEQKNGAGTPGGVEEEKQWNSIQERKTMQREQKQVERSSKTGTGTINARDMP